MLEEYHEATSPTVKNRPFASAVDKAAFELISSTSSRSLLLLRGSGE